MQAITDAGGLHFGASPGSVVVSRRGREGPGQTISFDYDGARRRSEARRTAPRR